MHYFCIYIPEMKYPPCPVDPSTKSCDSREASSGSVKPTALPPVEVGVPSGASAVNLRTSAGRASTSASAVGGELVTPKIVAVDNDTRPFAIQLRREDCLDNREWLLCTSAESAVHVAAVMLRLRTTKDEDRGAMVLIALRQIMETWRLQWRAT